jgi:hypothetical protein
MTRIKLMGLALMAVFAFAAVSVATAQAADPILLVCSKTAKGKFTDSDCLNEVAGEYELLLFLPGETIKVLTTSGEGKLATATGESITCTADSSGGEIVSEDTINNVVVRFTGCEGKNAKGEECEAKSETGAAHEIVTKTLKALLGLVPKTQATSGVGLLFEPVSGPVFVVTQGSCLVEGAAEGTVAGEVNPINKATLILNLSLVGGAAAGHNRITEISILGKTVKPSLKAFGLVAASEVTAATIKVDETAIEIM